jgi:hypothetical protein
MSTSFTCALILIDQGLYLSGQVVVCEVVRWEIFNFTDLKSWKPNRYESFGILIAQYYPQYCYFIVLILNRVRLSPLGTAATIGLFYLPQMIDDSDCGAVGGMKSGRGNRSTPRKPAPTPLCPQIPHDQTRARTRAATVGSQRLTAWTMAPPCPQFSCGTNQMVESISYLNAHNCSSIT